MSIRPIQGEVTNLGQLIDPGS